MDLSHLRPPDGATTDRKRVGRGPGSGNGKTAGRGNKGAQSRAGYKAKRGFEGGQMPLHRRIPKRGFHNPFRVEYAVVNLDQLEERFEAGAVVTVEALQERGLVAKSMPVKVLGRGDLAKALTVRVHKCSASATTKIQGAGGTVEPLATTPAEA